MLNAKGKENLRAEKVQTFREINFCRYIRTNFCGTEFRIVSQLLKDDK